MSSELHISSLSKNEEFSRRQKAEHEKMKEKANKHWETAIFFPDAMFWERSKNLNLALEKSLKYGIFFKKEKIKGFNSDLPL